MVAPIAFATNTDLAQGLRQLIAELETRLQLRQPLKMYVAGGMALHLYTGSRVTTDVDAEFSKRIMIPENLVVQTAAGRVLYLDTNYNSSFALMHEDYLDDALRVPLGSEFIELYVLHPLDLILSKIARFRGPDADDIKQLIGMFAITPTMIESRAEVAMQAYVGNDDYLRMHLQDVLAIARDNAAKS